MKRGRKGNAGFGRGAFSGFVEYRYGSKRPVTLAPILKGKQREHVVNRVIDALKGWHLSPFEHEAAALHGLRQGFCLDGKPFGRADAEAVAIVAEGLRTIGAERPSWEQGQRQYADGADHCRWCGQPLPDDATTGNRNSAYCSTVCGAAAYAARAETDLIRSRAVYNSAHRAARRQAMPARVCTHCRTNFRPIDEAQTFCSLGCSNAHRSTLPESPCLTCGKLARWDVSQRERKYCSMKCYGARPMVVSVEKDCLLCRQPFMAVTGKAEYCSEEHARIYRKLRASIRSQRSTMRITPPVFDYVFTAAA